MFVELVRGRAVDRAGLHEAWDQAVAGIVDDAVGWLGATAGLASHGGFVAFLGFESEEAARITMDRLDGRAAWDRLTSLVPDRTFRECPNVRALCLRDPRHTDFVEVTQGPANDIGRIVSVFESSGQAGTANEAVIGGLLCWDDTGFTSCALYFRSPQAGAASTPNMLRQDAEALIDRPEQFDLAGPWSILTVAGPPSRNEPGDDRPVPP